MAEAGRVGGGDEDPGGFMETEVTSEDTGGGTTGAVLGGKGTAAGTRGGMEIWSIGGAVLGPGSKRPWRISENACCRLTADADIESPKAGGA